MDVFRPRAIPALTFAIACCASHAACEALNGTYKYEVPAAAGELRPHYLSDLTLGPERNKLVRTERPSGGGLSPGGVRNRPKESHLAATGSVAAVARGATIEFHDAQGKHLATLGIGEGWSCRGDALERNEERTAGLGDNIRTERVQERLARKGNDLVYTEIVTIIEPAGGRPKRAEIHFAAVK